MNYRKIYENHFKLSLPKNFDVHHIDGDRCNNEIKNLISLPKKFHKCLHNWVGLIDMESIETLLLWYNNAMEKGITYTSRALGYYMVVKYKRLAKNNPKIEKQRRKYLKDLKNNQRLSLSKLSGSFVPTTSGRNIYDEKTQHINWVGEK